MAQGAWISWRWPDALAGVAAALLVVALAMSAGAIPVGSPAGSEAVAADSPARTTEIIPVEPIPAGAMEKAAEGPGAPAAPAGTGTRAEPRINLSKYFPTWAQKEVGGNALWQFIAAVVFLAVGILVKHVSDFLFRRRIARLQRLGKGAQSGFLVQSLSRPLGFLFLLGGLASGLGVFSLPTAPVNVQGVAYAALKVLVGADLVWFLFRLVDLGVAGLARLAGRRESTLDDKMIPVLRKALKVVIGIVCAVWVIQLLDYSVSGLLAGLGIGGLAVALGLQDTLANLFGSVFIFLDRPFRLGDEVRIGDVEGKVEDIGFRSTRIRTWTSTLVSIPNKTVASVTIDNLSSMPKRRVTQTIAMSNKTAPDQMAQALAALREVIEGDPGVDRDCIVVRFTDFAPASLTVTVLYFTKAVPYRDHLVTRERVNLAILRKLRDLGVSVG